MDVNAELKYLGKLKKKLGGGGRGRGVGLDGQDGCEFFGGGGGVGAGGQGGCE